MSEDTNLYHVVRPIPKPEKPVKLKGKALDDQNQKVYIRDNGHCVLCGFTTVAPIHHIEHGTGNKSDEEKNKAVICNSCHSDYHAGNDNAERNLIRKIIENWGFKKFVQLFLKGYISEIYKNR
jgi:5-methylcytosine-specific restriction endonuclease McrA